MEDDMMGMGLDQVEKEIKSQGRYREEQIKSENEETELDELEDLFR